MFWHSSQPEVRRFTVGVEFALQAALEPLDEAAACSVADAAKGQDERIKVATAAHSPGAGVSGSAPVDCIPGRGSGIARFGYDPLGGAPGIANHCSTGQSNIDCFGLSFKF